MNHDTVRLSDLVIALRGEIDRMQEALASSGGPAILEIEKAEVELTFGVEATHGGKGGISFKVFGIGFEGGAEAGRSDLVTQKLKLSLVPAPGADVGVAEE